MFRLHLFFLVLFLVAIASISCLAVHIVGGEISMRPLAGSDKYEVKLIQFWDANHLTITNQNELGNRDVDANLFIYRKRNNQLLDSVLVTFQHSEDIVYQNKSCASERSLRTILGIYTGEISLPPSIYNDPEGYYIAWERCCRNGDINNIKDPGGSGMVFYLEFPPTNVIDSSPQFSFPNGQYICVNQNFSMNMSATDDDNDQLIYSLVVPMRGYTNPGLTVGVSAPKNGYPLVEWADNININNVIPGSSPLSINASTGVLSLVANTIGLYVFTVQCEEYRNGRKIGVVRRDFQLLVIDCNMDQPDPPIIMINAVPVKDEVQFCPEKPILLQAGSSGEWYYQWQKDGLNIVGATSDTLFVSETGTYKLIKSFTKKCAMDASSRPLIVSIAESPDAKINMDRDMLCPGETMELSASHDFNESNNEGYTWSSANGEIARDVTSIFANEPGMYILEITDLILGCVGSDTISLSRDSLVVSLPERLITRRGVDLHLKPDILPPRSDYNYLWTPSDDGLKSLSSDQNAVVSPEEDTYYFVQVTAPGGCIGVDSVWIELVEPLLVPTAFSPDGNNLNETLEIKNGSNQIVEITIFNRWGLVVFWSEGYLVPWNGMYKNEIVAAGSYPYIIKTKEKVQRGEIMVLR